MRNRDRVVNAYGRGYVLGQVATYCEQVSTGAKLAAQVGLPLEFIGMAKDYVEREGLRYLEDEPRSADRGALWIFKYAFVEELIRSFRDRADLTKAGVWTMGKLFGYSDVEIARFIGEECGSESVVQV